MDTFIILQSYIHILHSYIHNFTFFYKVTIVPDFLFRFGEILRKFKLAPMFFDLFIALLISRATY